MRVPTDAGLVPVSVIDCPTIGARFESNASTNASSCRCSVSFSEKTPEPWKRKSVSTLPSWRKPKPRTWSP